MPDEKKKTEEVVEDEVSDIALEKALDTAIEGLQKADSKKALPPSDEEDEAGEDEEEEEGEYKKEPMKKKVKKSEAKKSDDDEPDFDELSKSLEESVLEKEEGAQEVIDAVPFMKALMDSLEDQMTEMIKAVVYVSDKVDSLSKKLEKSEKINIAEAKLIKSLSENVRKIGDLPIPRKSVLGQGLEIVRKSGETEEKFTLTKTDALGKVTELCKADKITLDEAIMIEGRINKGLEVPDRIKRLLTS